MREREIWALVRGAGGWGCCRVVSQRWFARTRACELAGPGRVGAGCPSEPGFNLAFESVS